MAEHVGPASDWHEDDALWAEMGPVMFSPEKLAAAALEIERALALAAVPPGARVLEIPCGVGRHTVELARRGMHVVAVDRTATYLDQARRRLAEAGQTAEVVLGDMRTFTRPGAFDAIFNIFTSFGYFEDEHENLAAARCFCDSLRPGGRLVMELTCKEALARRYQRRIWHELADGSLLLEEAVPSADWSMMRTTWRIWRDGRWRTTGFQLKLYSAAELAALLRQAGFASIDVFGGLDGSPFDATAQRLAVVAHKAPLTT